jgi:HK97 gp10 family phage protein
MTRTEPVRNSISFARLERVLMGDVFKYEIEGMARVNEILEQMTKCFPKDDVEKVSNSAARIITKAAKEKAPYDEKREEGTHLRDAIKTKKLKRIGTNPAPSIAAIDRKKAPHAHLVEYGHVVTNKKGGEVLGFAPAHPFFRPAVDENGQKSLEYVEKRIKRMLKKAMKKKAMKK